MKKWIEQETKLRKLAAESSYFMADAVHSALEKFQAGTYGKCEQCDDEIALAVLEERPWARMCASCQNAQATQEMPALFHMARAQ